MNPLNELLQAIREQAHWCERYCNINTDGDEISRWQSHATGLAKQIEADEVRGDLSAVFTLISRGAFTLDFKDEGAHRAIGQLNDAIHRQRGVGDTIDYVTMSDIAALCLRSVSWVKGKRDKLPEPVDKSAKPLRFDWRKVRAALVEIDPQYRALPCRIGQT